MSEKLYYYLTKRSSNRKTGPIAVLTSSRRTCPDSCPFKGNGCYAEGGPLRLHWNKSSTCERGYSLNQLTNEINGLESGSLIRLFQAGDLPGVNKNIRHGEVEKLVDSLSEHKAFGYTHKPVDYQDNAEIIKHCNDNDVCINLSANNLSHADELYDYEIGPVSVTLTRDTNAATVSTPTGRRVVVCPAARSDNVSCMTCGNGNPLCSRTDRNYMIGFPAHGSGINKASEVASEVE